MIALIITLPFYTSYVYAVSSGNIVVYSKDKYNTRDYRAVSDTTTIFAEIPESGVQASSINFVSGDKAYPFSACEYKSGISLCSYKSSEGKETSMRPGKYSYSVRSSSISSSYSGSSELYVDEMPPNITINSITTNTNNTVVSYSIFDTAYQGGTGICSAVYAVGFYLGDSLLKTIELNQTPGVSCNTQRTDFVDAPSTNDVERDFCVKAMDNVGNTGTSCKKIIIDKEAGSVSNAKLLTLDGSPMDYISTRLGSLKGKIEFTLTERNLVSKYADVSEFNPVLNQRQMPISCNPENCNGTCKCTINNIDVLLTKTTTPNLKVYTTDASGNTGENIVPMQVYVDNEAPVLKSLKSLASGCADKNAIGPENNTVVAVFDEAGSGFSARKVYLDLSSVKKDYTKVRTNECTQSGNLWTCKWGLFSVDTGIAHSSSPSISVAYPSQDDAGNFVQSEVTAPFIYDNAAPIFLSSAFVAASSSSFGDLITEYPTSGGTIELTVFANDDLPVKATADFSSVSFTGKRTVDCTNGACVFSQIGPLFNGPISDVAIPVTLTDCVGNSMRRDVLINISDIEGQGQDYWVYSASSPMPDKLDKTALKIIPAKMFFPVALSGRTDVVPIIQQVVECVGEKGYLSFNLHDQRLPDLINAPSTSIYTKFGIQRAGEPPNSLVYTCTFVTISRTSQGIISQPEYDNLTFTIPFYNSPLGTIEDSLQKKMNEVKDSPLVQGKWIGEIKKWVDIAKGVCSVYSMIQGIGSVLSFIAQITGWMQKTVILAYISYITRLIATYFNIVTTFLGNIMGPFCSVIGCTGAFAYQDAVNKFFENYQRGFLGFGNIFSSASGSSTTNAGSSASAATGKENPWTSFLVPRKYDPQGSLIISTVSLCLPGMLYNLQKARAIDCNYITCLKTQVPAGVPPYFCTSQRASQWCKYVVGEIFQLLPMFTFLDEFADAFKKYLTDPVFLFAQAVGWCSASVDNDFFGLCSFIQNTLKVKSIIDELSNANYWNNKWNPQTDSCAEVLK